MVLRGVAEDRTANRPPGDLHLTFLESLIEESPPRRQFEGIHEVFDFGRFAGGFWPDDGDDVEPGGVFQQAVALEKHERGAGDAALLFEGDCGGGGFVGGLLASFYFDEDDGAAIDGH